MSLQSFLDARWIVQLQATKADIAAARAIVDRDLSVAEAITDSNDWRFRRWLAERHPALVG